MFCTFCKCAVLCCEIYDVICIRLGFLAGVERAAVDWSGHADRRGLLIAILYKLEL